MATRLTPFGTVDTSFGVDGKLVVSLAPNYDLHAAALAGGGGCGRVISGTAIDTNSASTAPGFAVLRLTP